MCRSAKWNVLLYITDLLMPCRWLNNLTCTLCRPTFLAPESQSNLLHSLFMSSLQSCGQLQRCLDNLSAWQVSRTFTVGSVTAGFSEEAVGDPACGKKRRHSSASCWHLILVCTPDLLQFGVYCLLVWQTGGYVCTVKSSFPKFKCYKKSWSLISSQNVNFFTHKLIPDFINWCPLTWSVEKENI